MVRIRPNAAGFARLRSLNAALILSEGDRRRLLLPALDEVARTAANKAFTSQGGGTWPALSPRYAAWKRRAGHGSRMMVMAKPYRGRQARQMREGFTKAGGPGHIRRWVGGFRFVFGIADDVAYRHEHGGGTLPRRSVLDFILAAKSDFIRVARTVWIGRVRQVIRGQQRLQGAR